MYKYPTSGKSAYDGAVSVVDKWGNRLTPPEEIQAIRRSGIRESDELPDIDASCFESYEDYQEWVANGCQRFMA